MNAYERLKSILDDLRTISVIDGTFHSIIRLGVSPAQALAHMADRVCSMHGLSGEVHNNAVVFYHLGSRGKQPACLVAGLQAGQSASPSAQAYRSTAFSLLQVFEGDADDRDVERPGAVATHRLETKGRVLFH